MLTVFSDKHEVLMRKRASGDNGKQNNTNTGRRMGG